MRVAMTGSAADYLGATILSGREKELLNWSPTTPLVEGVLRCVSWLNETEPSQNR